MLLKIVSWKSVLYLQSNAWNQSFNLNAARFRGPCFNGKLKICLDHI